MKRRWAGKTISAIFNHDFPLRSPSYYDWAIATGHLRVEGMTIGVDHVVAESATIRHLMHRHEPSCFAEDIAVHHQSDDFLVVYKPAGMPVHPAGPYHKNTGETGRNRGQTP